MERVFTRYPGMGMAAARPIEHARLMDDHDPAEKTWRTFDAAPPPKTGEAHPHRAWSEWLAASGLP